MVACLVAVLALHARLFGFLVGLGARFVGFLAALLVGLVLASSDRVAWDVMSA